MGITSIHEPLVTRSQHLDTSPVSGEEAVELIEVARELDEPSVDAIAAFASSSSADPARCHPVCVSDHATATARGVGDERTLLLGTLGFLRDAVLRKVGGITEQQAGWRPEGRLLPLVGIVHHLACVEWRWIDGAFLGADVERSEDEFAAPGITLEEAVAAYRSRAAATDEVVLAAPSLDARGRGVPIGADRDLRFILVHVIQETARHAGHADATREMLDGATGW
jgi:hypothetical protein